MCVTDRIKLRKVNSADPTLGSGKKEESKSIAFKVKILFFSKTKQIVGHALKYSAGYGGHDEHSFKQSRDLL